MNGTTEGKKREIKDFVELNDHQAINLFNCLMLQCHNARIADLMSDGELADALLNRIWAKTNIHSLDSALLESAIDRLRENEAIHLLTVYNNKGEENNKEL